MHSSKSNYLPIFKLFHLSLFIFIFVIPITPSMGLKFGLYGALNSSLNLASLQYAATSFERWTFRLSRKKAIFLKGYRFLIVFKN